MKARYPRHGLVTGAMGWLQWWALACLLLVASSSALAAKTYSDNGDGTVTDPTTGLMWMRCAMGQTWTGSTCTGTASTYTFDQANALTGTSSFAGQSAWRVPNIRELQTIVDRSVYSPAIDSVAFPNTPSSYFWSGSPYANFSDYAWLVYFSSGGATSGGRGNYYSVRLVRAGQSIGLLDMARPSTDYVDHGDGTVTHGPTALMWQRCAVGQVWSGSTCTGSASTHTWDAARLLTSSFAGHSDWRLPTEDELVSLVDYTYLPAINVTLFPTLGSVCWSGSPNVDYSANAWNVSFYNGVASNGGRSYYFSVRLVRADQSLGPLALSVSKGGAGSGTITSAPAGIDCGATCSASFTSGTSVTLTATPTTGSTFTSWSGACSGTGSCVVSMSADQSVTATFAVAASTGTLITRYRLYSDNTHEHLYTTDLNEYNVLSAGGGWLAEGAIYKLFQGAGSLSGVDAVQYYRLYNPSSYQHHWTTDLNEYNVLGAGGWSKEGVDGYILPTAVAGSVPLYRLYLNAFGGLHLWTTDANEKKVLSTTNGWIDEGVAGYVLPLP